MAFVEHARIFALIFDFVGKDAFAEKRIEDVLLIEIIL